MRTLQSRLASWPVTIAFVLLMVALLFGAVGWWAFGPQLTPSVTQLARANGFSEQGFTASELGDSMATRATWIVKNPEGWCQYQLYREVPQLPFGKTRLYLRLTSENPWWQGDRQNDLRNSPPLEDPTPETAWSYAQEWGDPPEYCKPAG